MKRILFLQKPELLGAQHALVESALRSEWPGVTVDAAGSAETVPAGVYYDAVITPTSTWLSEALARTGGTDWIHFLSAGVDAIWDMPFAKEEVILTKSSGVHAIPIAEHVLGTMLHFAKRFDRYLAQSRDRVWAREWSDELAGRTVLVLGAGQVGGEIVRRCAWLGMTTLAVGRSEGNLDALDLSAADYMVVCLPLTDATRGLVDRSLLARLKPGAVLIDVSRGGVVEADAVVAALDAGQLRGAALDVFAEEPLPPDSPLWGREGLLITPHVAGTSPRYLDRALAIFIHNARCRAAGEPLPQRVDLEAGY